MGFHISLVDTNLMATLLEGCPSHTMFITVAPLVYKDVTAFRTLPCIMEAYASPLEVKEAMRCKWFAVVFVGRSQKSVPQFLTLFQTRRTASNFIIG